MMVAICRYRNLREVHLKQGLSNADLLILANLDKLQKLTLSSDGPEKYQINWHGLIDI